MARCPVCSGDHPRSECPDAAELLVAGARLDDKYTVVRHISTGGMGAVYEVEHVALGKRLAAKLLLPELCRRGELLERFRREARAASATGHENIVEVTDLGQTSARIPFLVMELLNGRTLGSELKTGRLAPERAVHITRQVLSALTAAHARGIVHRDLKPENVFLIQRAADPDFVKVLDFGIAKMLDEVPERELTQAGQVVGTPTYMSPEQARGDPHIDARADLYATGAMLYRMVTGHRPFTGANFNALLFAIAQGNPTPVRKHAPEVSPELDAAIRKAMALDRRNRFASAEEFDEALASEDRTNERAKPAPPRPRPLEVDDSPPAPSTPGWEMRSMTMMGHGSSRRSRVASVVGRAVQVIIVVGLALITAGVGWLAFRRYERSRAEADLRAEAERAHQRAEEAARAAAAMKTNLIALTIEVEPPAARVTLDGALVTGSEQRLARDGQRHVLRVEADGYQPEERPFFAAGDARVAVHLKQQQQKKKGRSRPAGPADEPDEGLDPVQVKTIEKLINKLGEEAKGATDF